MFQCPHDHISYDNDPTSIVAVRISNLSNDIVNIGKKSDIKQLKSDAPFLPITLN
jgi:hypothetical protein